MNVFSFEAYFWYEASHFGSEIHENHFSRQSISTYFPTNFWSQILAEVQLMVALWIPVAWLLTFYCFSALDAWQKHPGKYVWSIPETDWIFLYMLCPTHEIAAEIAMLMHEFIPISSRERCRVFRPESTNKYFTVLFHQNYLRSCFAAKKPKRSIRWI